MGFVKPSTGELHDVEVPLIHVTCFKPVGDGGCSLENMRVETIDEVQNFAIGDLVDLRQVYLCVVELGCAGFEEGSSLLSFAMGGLERTFKPCD